jgi:hypothetical protein
MSAVDARVDGGRRGRLLSVIKREIRAVLPPTLFFFVGFNLVLFTNRCFSPNI